MYLETKAMRNSEIYAITCYGEFRTSGLPEFRRIALLETLFTFSVLSGLSVNETYLFQSTCCATECVTDLIYKIARQL